MKVILNKTENRTSYLTIEMEQSDLYECVDKVFQRIVEKTKVPGFSKGNAPRDVLEKHVGRDKMVEYAIKEKVYSTYSKIINEQKLENAMQPIFKIVQTDPPIIEMVVPLKPLVELGDYHDMHVEPESLEIKKEEVDKILEGLRNQFTNYRLVDRPVIEKDLISIDIKGTVSGSTFLRGKSMKFQVTPEFDQCIPGLHKKMIGIKKGEEKEFKLILPKDYPDKLVAGKKASFKVKVYDVQVKTLPELNDEFANKVAPGVKTLDSLRERIVKNMRLEREQNAESRFEEKVVDSLIEISKLEYPPIMIDMDAENMVTESLQRLQASCKDEREYEKKLKQVSEDKIKEQFLPMAKRRVLWSLILNEVAKTESIEVDDKEVNEEIERMTRGSEEEKEVQREYLNDYQNRKNVLGLLKARKAIKRLVEIVQASNN